MANLRLGLILPRRLRRWVADQMILKGPSLAHRVYVSGRWKVEKWNSIQEPIPSSVLRANPLRYGKPIVEEAGYNGVTNVGEEGLLSLFTATAAGTAFAASFDNANTRIAVGSGVTGFDDTQTALVTELARVGMNVGYPQAGGTREVDYQSDFAGATGDGAWNEWGLFNHATVGDMFSRLNEPHGTKSGGTWTLTVTYNFDSV